ncbi:hypothetical protein FE782_03765 [Paenibacillus antri]|uniref:Uncharacterized protein n=1 Tax=Paenibacillus antri TaxID=2582848 RepID=A0A5R9GE49_9BACL|nr:hypothetical protein [Paenibacillus antri]TLS53399.1 hypothetical protein FE782_03765 [Paenibacillus antri]
MKGYQTFSDSKGRRGKVGSQVFVYTGEGSLVDGRFTVIEIGRHGANGTYLVLDPAPFPDRKNVGWGPEVAWASQAVIAK